MRRVVVTAQGVVSPIGIGVQSFFDGLARGISGVSEITRFDAGTFPTRVGAEVRGVLPGISWDCGALTEAVARDRKCAFGISAAVEAATSAFPNVPLGGYAPDRIGLSVAAGLELLDVADLMHSLSVDAFSIKQFLASIDAQPLYATSAIPAEIGARVIRKQLGLRGPFTVNLSACAASTQAIGDAFLAIREGAADAMVAGGYDSMLNPLGLGGFCLLEAMTKSNERTSLASRPFDVSRDGFVLGEGAAFFTLEWRDTAIERGAKILAEILGYGSTLDAYRVTDPEPNGEGAFGAMAQAMAMANVDASDIDYVNAHGTGTPKNDPVEATAIRKLLGSDVERVYVSSTKSQIGHLIGAAGAVEFSACLFALERQCVPATITLERPDPACALRHVPKLPIQTEVRRVLSNSLGFGGQNASIVLAHSQVESSL
jgi:3-oxoacyl-[acyl-carrier-protein] synthase II